MLEYVPVRFDLYRAVQKHLRWTLQCLVSFADRSGKCWPSVRKLAEHAGISKSAAARHLCALSRIGIVTRRRRPGGVYTYHIDSRFLPAGRVSHRGDRAVPPAATEEKPIKNNEDATLDFKWRMRVHQWRKFGRWVAAFGPQPGEPGCRVPAEILSSAGCFT